MAVAKSPPIIAPAQRSLEELAATLSAWLPTRMLGAQDVRISDVQYPRGAGMSHETILFQAQWREDGMERERGLVVRIKPGANKQVYVDDMFVEQFKLMQAARASGKVKVAETLWLEEDPGLLGAPFFVMERMNGRVPVSYPPYTTEGWFFDATPAQRRKAWEGGLRQLASIQLIPRDTVQFLDFGEGRLSGFEQELDRYRRLMGRILKPGPLPFHERAFEEIVRTAPKNWPEGIVWGDARIGNIMFDEAFEVVGVMDWEQPSLGGALHDLAWWLYNEDVMTSGKGVGRPDGMGSPEEARAIWSEVTGIPVSDMDWYLTFAAFKGETLRIHMIDGGWFKSAPGMDYADSHGTRFIAEKLGWESPKPQPTR